MPRRSSAGCREVTSAPSIDTVPLVGSTMRLTMRNDVVLPHPEGPTKTVIRPSSATRSSWSTATVPSGNRFVTDRNSIIGRSLPITGSRSPAAHGSVRTVTRHPGGCTSP